MSKTIHKGETNRAASADVSVADPNSTVTLTAEEGREAECPSNGQPTSACEEMIRARAHSKWEAADCPAGDGVEFWLEAEREVNAERPDQAPLKDRI